MKRSILKPIAFGLLFGAAAFFAPFMILKVMFFFFIIGGIMRMIFWGRYRGGGHQYYMAYADKIRGMSEDEYSEFKNTCLAGRQEMNNWRGGCGYHRYDYCHNNSHNYCEENQDKNQPKN